MLTKVSHRILVLFALLCSILNQVGHINGHLLNSCIVKLLNVMQGALVFLGDKVDSDALSSESSSAANTIRLQEKRNEQIARNKWTKIFNVEITGEYNSHGWTVDRSWSLMILVVRRYP